MKFKKMYDEIPYSRVVKHILLINVYSSGVGTGPADPAVAGKNYGTANLDLSWIQGNR